MIIIAGFIRMPPESIDRARAAAAAMITATRAEQGCKAYRFSEDLVDRGVMHIFEVWEDQASLTAHAKSEHMGVWRAATKDLGISGRDLKMYDGSNERAL